MTAQRTLPVCPPCSPSHVVEATGVRRPGPVNGPIGAPSMVSVEFGALASTVVTSLSRPASTSSAGPVTARAFIT